jgi:hypothetical protein
MSQEHGRNDITYDADASLVDATAAGTFLHRFVKTTANQTVGLCGNAQRATGVVKGIAERTGMGVTVRTPGGGVTSKIVAGAVFAAGVALTSDAAGKARAAIAGEEINAYSDEAAAAINDVVECRLIASGKV